jgi:hypothetical protein
MQPGEFCHLFGGITIKKMKEILSTDFELEQLLVGVPYPHITVRVFGLV